jgi:predicted nucleic acid-binding protein
MIVLDTNVLSELMKPAPDARVLRWFDGQPGLGLFITSITQAEILFGLELLPDGKRRAALAKAADDLFAQDFAGRILPFDSAAAAAYARIVGRCRAAGRPISHFDAQIASIAHSRGASLATRIVPDFESCGLILLNPWVGS